MAPQTVVSIPPRQTRLERLLDKAVHVDDLEFGEMAVEMPLSIWQRACRARLVRQRGNLDWTWEQWQAFDAQAEAAYTSNCAYMAALPPSPRIVRPDAGRLYREEPNPS